jgi:hypothetical protein
MTDNSAKDTPEYYLGKAEEWRLRGVEATSERGRAGAEAVEASYRDLAKAAGRDPAPKTDRPVKR